MKTGFQKYKKYVKAFWIIYTTILLLVFFFFFGISKGWLGFMPSFQELENPKSLLASEIYSSDQELIGTYFLENRSNVTYNDLSPYLVDALTSTEDARYKEHAGIDGIALTRVLYGALTLNPKGGGSTITQQLAKLLFSGHAAKNKLERAMQKFKEWVIAVQLEKRYSKDEIMTMYYNKFDFLNLAVGIKSASRIYFNKTPKNLSLEEAATLVGMCKNPAIFNPNRESRRDTTQHRRNVVLKQMVKYEKLLEKDYDSLKTIPLELNFQKVDHKQGIATYLREDLRKFMKKWSKENPKPDGEIYNIYKDGLKIYTTIDSRMQNYAENAVKEHLKKLQKDFFKHWKGRAPWIDENYREIKGFIERASKGSQRYRNLKRKYGKGHDSINIVMNTPTEMKIFTWNGDSTVTMTPMDSIRYYKHFLHTGFMSIDPYTGHIKAYVGGIDYNHFQYDHVSTGRRQVGSTFKPFVYLTAIRSGLYHPCSPVQNIPVTFHLPEGKTWTPSNAAKMDCDYQTISLKFALAHSINWISAKLIKEFSPTAVIQLARDLGITAPIDTVPSICLGTPDISVYEMVGAHATFANKGVYTKPIYISRIEDKHGNTIYQSVPETKEVLDERTSYLMLNLMEGVTQFGSGLRLRGQRYAFRQPIAGKTGTTQNHSDGWFIGSTPDLVSGVWVGADDRAVHFRSLRLGQGANMALPIWALYMKQVWGDSTLTYSQGAFERPESIDIDLSCKEKPITNPTGNSQNNLGKNLPTNLWGDVH